MRKILTVLVLASSLALTGCGAKNPTLCDMNRSLQGAYSDSGHVAPSDIQDSIDEYC